MCSAADSILVTALPSPVVDLGPDVSLCDVSAVTLDAGPGGIYLWSTGATTQTIAPGVSGIYWVNYSNGFCAANDTIIVSSLNVEPVSLGEDFLLCDYDYAELDAGPGSTYLWNTGETTQTISPDYAGTYYVTVGTGNCTSSDTIELAGSLGESVLYIPNTITPDGNGLNDAFYVYSADVMEFRMRIFDRWGELIFESTDINTGWDGTYKGNKVQQDTYVYVIDYSTTCNGTVQKKIGNVNVAR